jgi:predicted GIY-YIG superfamily endonuclease
MSVHIYLIEDINGLKYVGSTKNKLNIRLSHHKADQKLNRRATSKQLDLLNCSIKTIDTTDETNRLKIEKYWINKIDCVNVLRYDFDRVKYMKQYNIDNKEHLKIVKSIRETNVKNWRNSFGGCWRRGNDLNNLLLIDIDLFK